METGRLTLDSIQESDKEDDLGVERDLTYYAIRRKPEVILLNGPSSAGKSSVAKVLRQRLCDSGKPPGATAASVPRRRLSNTCTRKRDMTYALAAATAIQRQSVPRLSALRRRR